MAAVYLSRTPLKLVSILPNIGIEAGYRDIVSNIVLYEAKDPRP